MTAPGAESTGRGSAAAFAAGMSAAYVAQAEQTDAFVTTLTTRGVGGSAVAAGVAAQQASEAAGAAWGRAHTALAGHGQVSEAYEANPGAGTKDFVTDTAATGPGQAPPPAAAPATTLPAPTVRPALGGTVRPALAAATTLADVAAVAAAEARQLTGRDITVDMTGSDLQVAREHCEGVLRGLAHAPRTPVAVVNTYGASGARPARTDEGDEYANARGGDDDGGDGTEIGFNTAWAADPDRYRDSLRTDSATGGALNADPIGLAVHEFGHLVSHAAPSSHPFPGGVEFDAMDLARERAGGYGKYRDYVEQQISWYASWERGELTAEAFADVVLNQDAAAVLSQDIYALLVTDPAAPAPGSGLIPGEQE